MNWVHIGWQVVALTAVFAWFFTRSQAKVISRLFEDIRKLRSETTAWLQDQRSAHAKILEDHIARLKTLESAVGVSQARISSLEQINEVTKEPQAPGAIGPFLRNRKAGTT